MRVCECIQGLLTVLLLVAFPKGRGGALSLLVHEQIAGIRLLLAFVVELVAIEGGA